MSEHVCGIFVGNLCVECGSVVLSQADVEKVREAITQYVPDGYDAKGVWLGPLRSGLLSLLGVQDTESVSEGSSCRGCSRTDGTHFSDCPVSVPCKTCGGSEDEVVC